MIEARRGTDLSGDTRLRTAVAAAAPATAEQLADASHSATIEHAGATDDDLAILVLRRTS